MISGLLKIINLKKTISFIALLFTVHRLVLKINLHTCMKTGRSILKIIVIYIYIYIYIHIFTINAFAGPHHKVHIIESNELPLLLTI